VLIPEIPFDLNRVAERILERDRWGARFSIVVAAEGAHPAGQGRSVVTQAHDRVERLGGIAQRVAAGLEPLTGKEARFVVLGHLQRGGSPSAYDRMLATRFGAFAVDLIVRGQFGVMVALHAPDLVPVPLDRIVGRQRTVPLESEFIRTARNVGISFGD